MKNFFKTWLAALLAGLTLVFLVFLMIGGLVSGAVSEAENPKVDIKDNTILKFKVPAVLSDNGSELGFADMMEGKLTENPGLKDLITAIDNASTDAKVKGIMIEMGAAAPGFASLSELRSAFGRFKKSGKPIIAYGDLVGQKAYYVASVADSIFIHPSGGFLFKGLSANIMFFTKAMEQMGIKANIFYAGKFKSATEPFRLNKISPENRKQMKEYLDGLFQVMADSIKSSRPQILNNLDALANDISVHNPETALEYGFIDGIKHPDQARDIIQAMAGIEKKPKFLSLNAYSTNNRPLGDSKKRIAVLFAEGEIVDGKGGPGQLGDKGFVKAIQEVSKDGRNVAAVLRINSPGGSVLASEKMWRELNLLADKMPLIVSMGNVAASGGYYIACPGEKIFVDRQTITGSIGVFGIFPQFQGLQDKLALSSDTVSTHLYADLPNFMRDLDDKESELIQSEILKIYADFKGKVSESRGLSMEHVEAVAQGRVWLGDRAIEIGLADTMGGMLDAIAYAASKVDLSTYGVQYYPKPKSKWESLFNNMEAKGLNYVQALTGLPSRYWSYMDMRNIHPYQTRMFYDLEIAE